MGITHTIPARDLYRIDHATCGEYFYGEVWTTREAAQAHIDDRNPKYRDKLTIVKFHEPEHEAIYLGSI